MTSLSRSLWVLVPAFLFCSGANANAQDTSLIEAARKEGKLVWYATTQVQEIQATLNKFREKYPFIQSSSYRGRQQQVVEKFTTETRAGQHFADAIKISTFDFIRLKREGMLMKYQSQESAGYPKELKDKDGMWHAIEVGVHGLAFNTKLVPASLVPKSYHDLLDPRWKNKLGLDPTDEDWFGFVLKQWGEEKGLAFFRQLARQDIIFRAGDPLLQQLLISGEFPILVNTRANIVERNKKLGAPLDWVALEPTMVKPSGIALSAHAPHPNAARLFYEFLISKEGQAMQRDLGRIPARPGVEPDPPRLFKGFKYAVVDDAWMADNYDRILALYREVMVKKK